jgi:hypothetical protein
VVSEAPAERWKLGDALALAGVLALAFALRAHALSMTHDRGDQLMWAGVARHIAAEGAEGYTLRRVDEREELLADGAAFLRFDVAAVGTGSLLEAFCQTGERYWDAPLVNQPPGFFAVLLASHAILGEPGDGFPLLARSTQARLLGLTQVERMFGPRRDELLSRPASPERDAELLELQGRAMNKTTEWERGVAERIAAHPPAGAVRAQLWAVLPVLLADLGTVALLFVMVRRAGGALAGALAALAFATDPLALFCAHRLLSNAPLAFACLATLALEHEALAASGKRRLALSLGTGVAAGLAISIKVSAVFLLPAVVANRALRGELRDRSLALLLGVALALVTPWWLLQWRVLGHPLGLAWRNQPNRVAESPWGALVMGRDAAYYASSLARSPLVAAGIVAAVASIVRAARDRGKPLVDATGALFALAVILVAARWEEKEARHLVHAYPPLVLEGALALAGLARGRKGALLASAAAVAAVSAWQASRGLALAFDVANPP